MIITETQKIEKVASLLDKAKRIFFITGAGISADSGLPTYRGIGGLYNTNSTDEGIPIETALSGEMMEEDPAVPWKYLARMEEAARADLLVSRVGGVPACVPDRRCVDPRCLPEHALAVPEATEGEDRCLDAISVRWLQGCAEDGVPCREGDGGAVATGRRFPGRGDLVRAFAEEHVRTCTFHT